MNKTNEVLYVYGKQYTDPIAIDTMKRVRMEEVRRRNYFLSTFNDNCGHTFKCRCAEVKALFLAGSYDVLNAQCDEATNLEVRAYGRVITDPEAIALIDRIRTRHTTYFESDSCPNTIDERCNHYGECNCESTKIQILCGNYEQMNAHYDTIEKRNEKRERKLRERMEAKRARRREKQSKVEEDAKLGQESLFDDVYTLLKAYEDDKFERFFEAYDELVQNMRRVRKHVNYKRDAPY